ncbi:extracellular dihydrogeodin oxidase/laccase [Aspergillus aculeatinus CBS 121060]|uniref:Extracellular dihydrogeodin oxidase/laccase n=1 Tax=Aspergillus aculeatinus CBS 121060 TaxID=1448322 RepID=A0ACD1HMY6_9EURO|nr:extracellular dihydrogeodin oxidase/laccase [Aspergillus aculeatinus CBS 121060]RAH74886.1 extracellular dihydrogeodin oxidase/laccase [Aspergillus aculeatinus CBS 121060]
MNFLLLLWLLASLALSSPIAHDLFPFKQTSQLEARAANQSQSLQNSQVPWKGFDINTNYYKTAPDTGAVREYFFDIINTTRAPDGVERRVLLVNGQFPGPTIEANWGDTVKVHVTNRMHDNGTAIHFHGIRQLNNNQMDGVTALTQCPVPPGSSYTYVWKAEQYGSSWYHSHFSLQAWEGVYGGIVIHGPSTADYDQDLGVLFLSDWLHETYYSYYQEDLNSGRLPTMVTGLLNGTNVWVPKHGPTVGQRFQTTFVPGRRYRIRLVNTAMHTQFKVSIDNHDLTVIAADFVPMVPFKTNHVPIGMGQRYDIIVTANQRPDNYWIRAVPQSYCSNNTAADNIKGILRYRGSNPSSDPRSTKWAYGGDVDCQDFPTSTLVPKLALNADLGEANTVTSDTGIGGIGKPPIYLWKMGGEIFNTSWSDPTLLQTSDAPKKSSWEPGQGVIQASVADQWTVLIIQTTIPAVHPIHLHGHDFYILAQGLGTYDPSTVKLQTENPTRRDTLNLPAANGKGGYVVIGFEADNPGAWLIHCHIGFHAAEGFAQQIIERQSEFEEFLDRDVLEETCNAWNEWAETNPYGFQHRGDHGPYESGI